jgi:phospholipase C
VGGQSLDGLRHTLAGSRITRRNHTRVTELPADYLDPDKFLVSIQQARYKEIPSNYRKLGSAQIEDINHDLLCSEFTSHQETGIRPACVVPYELYVDGVLSADGSKFELSMTAGNQVHGQMRRELPSMSTSRI